MIVNLMFQIRIGNQNWSMNPIPMIDELSWLHYISFAFEERVPGVFFWSVMAVDPHRRDLVRAALTSSRANSRSTPQSSGAVALPLTLSSIAPHRTCGLARLAAQNMNLQWSVAHRTGASLRDFEVAVTTRDTYT